MELFNDGWQFAKGEPVGFAPVELPHDWLISDTDNLYESGTGWYKRELDADFLKDVCQRPKGREMEIRLYRV